MAHNSLPRYDLETTWRYSEKRWWLGLTIGDVLDKNADLYPSKEALIFEDRRMTYAQLKVEADKMAYGLLSRGFQQGDRVMLQLPNWAEFVIAHYALQKAGLVMVLLTVNHTAREIAHLAALTEPRGWILPGRYRGTDFLDLVEKVRKNVPHLQQIIITGETLNSDYHNFNDLAADADPQAIASALQASRPAPGDVCYLLPTGGTTNLPKCAVRTHNDYLCNVEYVARAWDITPHDISLVGTTVGHNLALLVAVSGPIFNGATIVLADSTRPEDLCRVMAQEKVTCVSLVPTLVSRLITYEDLEIFDLSPLTRIYTGAANSPPDLVRRVESRIGARYINAFGMVEGPCAQSRPGDSVSVRSESIGRPVCPYDDFQTLDVNGKKNPPGIEGEMAAKGPGIFSGYYRNPQTNEFAFTPDGYFRTGDLAVIDEEGRIRITGRIKDVIIRGGENISARDVEDMISSYQPVEYVSAVGMPDDDLGEVVCVFIKPIKGHQPTHDDIVAFMAQNDCPKSLIPARSFIVSEIPLTAAGKADKKLLREQIKKLVA